VATTSQDKHRGKHDHHQRWARRERAALGERYGELPLQILSLIDNQVRSLRKRLSESSRNG
jgi:hypothetical protein